MLCSFVKIVIINTRLRIINFCWSQSLFSATIQKPMTNCDRVFMEKTRVMQKIHHHCCALLFWVCLHKDIVSDWKNKRCLESDLWVIIELGMKLS